MSSTYSFCFVAGSRLDASLSDPDGLGAQNVWSRSQRSCHLASISFARPRVVAVLRRVGRGGRRIGHRRRAYRPCSGTTSEKDRKRRWYPEPLWGCSSVGRAPPWHGGSRRFESDQLHAPCATRSPPPRDRRMSGSGDGATLSGTCSAPVVKRRLGSRARVALARRKTKRRSRCSSLPPAAAPSERKAPTNANADRHAARARPRRSRQRRSRARSELPAP